MEVYKRKDGRHRLEIRKVDITRDYIRYAEGSVLIEVGETRVICAATVEDKVPSFLKDTGKGWITKEYQGVCCRKDRRQRPTRFKDLLEGL